MRFSRVCLLTPHQAEQFQTNGIVPDCRAHRHLSRAKADELVADHIVFRDDRGDYIRRLEAHYLPGKKFLVFVRSREWKRMDSAGTTCMQLVPAGGAW